MQRLKMLSAALMFVGLIVSAGHAQRSDSVSFDRAPELRLFPSASPVLAFTVHQNTLWYATANSVITHATNVARVQPQEFTTLGSIPASGVRAIAVENSGRVWFAAAGGVASRTGNNFTNYSAPDVPEGAARAVAVAPNGDVWVGTENGAARLKGNTWTKFTTEEGLPSNNIQAIAITQNGTVYLGTNRGIAAYDGSTFTVHNMRSEALSSNNVRVLHAERGTNNLWAAVGEGDVNYFANGTWRQFFQIRQGITSIAHDPTRRTWFGSPSGLDRFNGESWVNDPGLLGIQANQVHALFADPAGNMWFGMNDGVTFLSNPYRR